MASPYDLVSRDAQLALTEFSTEFDGALALGDVDTWAKTFGLVNSSRAIRTTYPIPVSAAGYVLRQGDDKMRSLFEKSLSMSPVEWVDGVAELARIIEAPDFIGWAGEPARIALEAQRQPNALVAAMLEANPTLEFDSKALFASDHPVNLFDTGYSTFDNDLAASAFDDTMMIAILEYFRGIKGPNGKPMGRRATDFLVPASLEHTAKKFLESDLMYNATLAGGIGTQLTSNNIYKGAVNLVVCDELTTAGVFYVVDKGGPKPWIVQDSGAPEEIQYTKDDELYKNTGKIGIKYVLTMAVAAALPHSIARVTIS
jgi:hypothetical protein